MTKPNGKNNLISLKWNGMNLRYNVGLSWLKNDEVVKRGILPLESLWAEWLGMVISQHLSGMRNVSRHE
jgi:hypothetical protein